MKNNAAMEDHWTNNPRFAEAKQEPIGEVECIDTDEDGQPSAWIKLHDNVELGDLLYTHPQPKREWVGLTDDEQEQIINTSMTPACAVISTEAKLKEKNTWTQ
jgi:hypothetical protein